jgi:hypothetical protein
MDNVTLIRVVSAVIGVILLVVIVQRRRHRVR